jgi:hypothetical protein
MFKNVMTQRLITASAKEGVWGDMVTGHHISPMSEYGD